MNLTKILGNAESCSPNLRAVVVFSKIVTLPFLRIFSVFFAPPKAKELVYSVVKV